jgi:hypothetical protein
VIDSCFVVLLPLSLVNLNGCLCRDLLRLLLFESQLGVVFGVCLDYHLHRASSVDCIKQAIFLSQVVLFSILLSLASCRGLLL